MQNSQQTYEAGKRRRETKTYVGNHDPSKRPQEHRVPAHKRQEPLRTSQDLPRHQPPPANKRTNDLPSSDIDISGEQDSHIVGRREGVGGDVAAEGGEHEREGGEEGGGAIVPFVDEGERVPEDFAVEDYAGGGDDDSAEGGEGEGDGDDRELDVLTGRARGK